MNRDELNELYRELENRMHKIIAPFASLHKGYDFSCGYYSGHYHKNVEGKYMMDFFPIPVVTVKGLCDIEIDLDKVSVSTKLRREVALNYSYEKLLGYEFEAYGVDEYLDDFYVKGNSYSELVENIASSKEKEIGFSFLFSEDVGAEEIYKCVKFLRKEGFFY
ncbi:MAG: hypothetical protein E7260_06445 [Lachnospiraceae bacterium]|nr:hypothetical protein [Lachnospiraceae bacterium]